jgi:hypothetical protein
MSSFDAFGIIFFNIPGDIDYQTIQHWARLMDPLTHWDLERPGKPTS